MTFGDMFWKKWAETVFLILLLLGFVIAVSLEGAFLKYLVLLLIGFMVGRFIYEKKGKQPLFPWILTILGLLVGFMLGAYDANRKGLTIVFFLGAILSYYMHKKGYIKI